MRAAAELHRVARNLDDADDVAVLLAEQHHRPELAGLVDRRLEDVHGPVLEDDLVDAALDLLALLACERLVVCEVEAKLVRPDRGSRLVHVVAEHVPQRLMQEVRPRVVRHRREAQAPRHARTNAISCGEPGAAEQEHLIRSSLYASTSSATVAESSSSSIVPASVTWPPPAG